MPQAVVAPYAQDVLSTFDIHKPEKLNQLFAKFGDQGLSYFMLLKSLGFELPTAAESYEHYEDRRIHDTFVIGANTAAGAAGASTTWTVNANSFQQLGANYYLYPRLWDLVMVQTSAGEFQGQITLVTNNNNGTGTIRVTPSRAAVGTPAVVTGQEIVITSDAWAAGSGQPTGRLSGTDKYINYLQIIKESLTATGSEMTNQDWFDEYVQDNGTSKKILGYVMKGQLDLDYRMNLMISNALLFGQITDNTNTDLLDPASLTNVAPTTTEGLIPAIRRAGNIETYTPGLFTTTKFNKIDKILDREGCGNDVTALLGIDLGHEVNDNFVNYFKETEINYTVANVFNNDAGLATSVGFKSFRMAGGRNFHFQKMESFSNPKIGGAPGYTFPQMGLFLPLNKKKDKLTNKMIPSIGCRYKELGAYSRKMEVFNISGAGAGQKLIPQDIGNWYQRAHIGAHHIGLNRFILLEP